MPQPQDPQKNPALQVFLAHRRRISDLGSAQALLEVDMEISMPKKGGSRRAEVAGTIAGLKHDLEVAPSYGDAIHGLMVTPDDLPLGWGRIGERARKDRELELKLPSDFVAATAAVTANCHQTWEHARPASDFSRFLPAFEPVVAAARERARLYDADKAPYDVLLDKYEEGLTDARVESVFTPVEAATRSLLARCALRPSPEEWRVSMPITRQKLMCRIVTQALGFDFEAGRLDVSAHPFTGTIHGGDIRLTTRYDRSDAMSAVLGAVHEAGHGMYEQGLPPEFQHVAQGQVPSLGLHEAISRLYENMVGHSKPFLRWFSQSFLREDDAVAADKLWRTVNAVRRPSYIRTEADELTYPLHIILRTRLEKKLVNGTLAPQDLPAAWNAAFAQSFGYPVPDDRRGCLQDTHWPAGYLGYFPCYTLGDVRSAQLFEAARRDLPGLEAGFERGEFLALRNWLRERVFKLGGTASVEEIMLRATGSVTDPSHYISHLTQRFSELYGF